MWLVNEDNLVHVTGGKVVYWRDGRTGALITSFRMKHNLLLADNCFINGELFMAVELGNSLDEDARYVCVVVRLRR